VPSWAAAFDRLKVDDPAALQLLTLTAWSIQHGAVGRSFRKDKYHALTELFTTGPWLPPTLAPS